MRPRLPRAQLELAGVIGKVYIATVTRSPVLIASMGPAFCARSAAELKAR
jgi:hypothetical protein